MLYMREELTNRIRAYAAEGYPNECCGAMLGRDGDAGREVAELLPLLNRRLDSARNRFSIEAQDVRAAEAAAAKLGLEVVGWYHSHPDHPARPSEFDREHAWPWYSYLIVAVVNRVAGEITAWRLVEDRSRFEPEALEVRAHAGA